MGCCSLDCFVYFVLSIALAFMAVSTTLPSPPDSNITKHNRPITHHDSLSLNASKALRQSNFKAIATLLHVSPEIFLSSSSPNTTLFAIDDSSLFNTSSLPPLFPKQLLRYHTLHLRLPMEELLEKLQGTCLPTLLRHQSVEISTVDNESRTAEVNHVMISHPDMFIGDSLVIHRVLGPFLPLQPHKDHIPQSSLCQSDSNKTVIQEEDWTRIIQLLSSNGFVHLQSDALCSQQDHCRSTQELDRSNNSSHTKSGLTVICFSVNCSTKSLDTGSYKDLIITRKGIVNSSKCFMISGVGIVAPDMFSSSNFVIHGIVKLDGLPT